MSQIPKWNHVLSVRNPQLDEQHIVLIELAKELIARLTRDDLDAPVIFDLFTDFADTVRHHDALEEALLEKNGCPSLPEHAASHRQSEAEVDRWLSLVRSDAYDPVGLVRYLDNWMQHHLSEMDMPVSGFMKLS